MQGKNGQDAQGKRLGKQGLAEREEQHTEKGEISIARKIKHQVIIQEVGNGLMHKIIRRHLKTLEPVYGRVNGTKKVVGQQVGVEFFERGNNAEQFKLHNGQHLVALLKHLTRKGSQVVILGVGDHRKNKQGKIA